MFPVIPVSPVFAGLFVSSIVDESFTVYDSR